MPPHEAALSNFQGGVVVHLNPEDEPRLPALIEILEQHRGKQPLYLQVTGSDGKSRRVRAGKQRDVSISEEFAREVDELLGRGRVRLARI